MKIAFRTDASGKIGTGHFMRCLTLADELKKQGVQIRFISRNLPPHLSNMLNAKELEFLPLSNAVAQETSDELTHAKWLGSSQTQDALANNPGDLAHTPNQAHPKTTSTRCPNLPPDSSERSIDES